MITGEQVKAARKLLGWPQIKAAAEAGLDKSAVSKFEASIRNLSEAKIVALLRAFEKAGVEFTNDGQPGVRLKAGIRVTRFDRHEEPDESD